MLNYNSDGIVNVGTGEDLTILELATTISEIVGYRGKLVFDSSRPDGTRRSPVRPAPRFDIAPTGRLSSAR